MDPTLISGLIYAGLGILGTIFAHRSGVAVPGIPVTPKTPTVPVPAVPGPGEHPVLDAIKKLLSQVSPTMPNVPPVVEPVAEPLFDALSYLIGAKAGNYKLTDADLATLASLKPLVDALVSK